MNFTNGVIELYVYNQEGDKVTSLRTLQEGDILFETHDDIYKLYVKDVTTDLKLIEFLGGYKEKKVSDWEKAINNINNTPKTLEFGNHKEIKCKLFAQNFIYDADNKVTHKLTYEMPYCTISKTINFSSSAYDTSKFDYVFNIERYDESGKSFKLHIREIENQR